MNEVLTKQRKIIIVVAAIVTAMSIQMDYEEILAKYSFSVYILIPLLIYFYGRMRISKIGTQIKPWGLAVGTSFFWLIGRSYHSCNSSELLFGSPIRILQFLFCMVGFSVLFFHAYRLAYAGLLRASQLSDKNGRFGTFILGGKGIWRLTAFILLTWLPVIILCYPGGSCIDVTYQISQTIGRIPYTTLHPLTHTLFVGFFVNLGNIFFHSYNVGLYLQILVQSIILASIQAFSLRRLQKRGVTHTFLKAILLIYCFAPMYSNFATMTIKDTLFNAFVLLFIVFLSELVFTEKIQISAIIYTVLSALAVMLFRNNGIYVVLAAGVAFSVLLFRNNELTLRKKTTYVLLTAVLPIILFLCIDGILTGAFHASTYSGKEALSIPFQQTGRYLRDYGNDITADELAHIEAVLKDADTLGELYDPNISDPIKRQFVETASTGDLLGYFGVWMKCFFRHPGVYFEAFLNHCYGWFDINLSNSIRYEGRLDIFSVPAIFGNSDKLLYYWFNFLNRVPFVGLLENVGFYVWFMFLLTTYTVKQKKNDMLVMFAPLYLSLLICIASPACLLHPRYAFPILFTLPFLTGLSIVAPVKRRMNKEVKANDK